MNSYLQLLECDIYSTLDEIKASYRRISKRVHPDLNPGINTQKFRDLTIAYNWLMENHKPKKQAIKDHGDKFYKQWNSLNSNMYVHLPIDEVLKDTSIYCMIRDDEFRVRLPAGMKLPAELKITNVFDRPFILHVIGSPETDMYMNDDL